MPRRYIDTSLGQLHARIEGQGPPLLLLGSAGRSASVFRRLLPLLSTKFRVIAPDLFGTGNSDPLPPAATIPSIAGAMDELLRACDAESASIYGFHTGNKIATALAANWPARVVNLVLAGQSHSLIPSNEERNSVIGGRTKEYFDAPDGDAQARAVRDWATLQRRVAALWWPDGLLQDSPQRAELLSQVRAEVLDELQCFESTPALYRINFAYDLASDLPRIRARTLVLEIATPDESRHLGAQGPRVCALIPGATLRTLHADGFRLTLEGQAQELAAVLTEFLGT
jgi:pimeloyl-ACP methyl ester carboxylesterase